MSKNVKRVHTALGLHPKHVQYLRLPRGRTLFTVRTSCRILVTGKRLRVDSAAVSIFVVILVELTITVFVNSTNITTNIETAVLFS